MIVRVLGVVIYIFSVTVKIRKIIPNELADLSVKAAPFVAPFYPGAAAAMRGFGRFDQRGSMSDAMKQAALTYGFGKGARYLGGAEGVGSWTGPQKYSMEGFQGGPLGKMWGGGTGGTDQESQCQSQSTRSTEPDECPEIVQIPVTTASA